MTRGDEKPGQRLRFFQRRSLGAQEDTVHQTEPAQKPAQLDAIARVFAHCCSQADPTAAEST